MSEYTKDALESDVRQIRKDIENLNAQAKEQHDKFDALRQDVTMLKAQMENVLDELKEQRNADSALRKAYDKRSQENSENISQLRNDLTQVKAYESSTRKILYYGGALLVAAIAAGATLMQALG